LRELILVVAQESRHASHFRNCHSRSFELRRRRPRRLPLVIAVGSPIGGDSSAHLCGLTVVLANQAQELLIAALLPTR
jgi:hypothetical protein